MRARPGKKPRVKSVDFSDPQIPSTELRTGMPALMAKYLEWMHVHHYSPETLRTDGSSLKLFAAWAAERGITRASEVTRPILERYQRYCFHYHTPQGQPLSISAQQHRLAPLKGFFRYLVRFNLILYNPAADLDIPKRDKRLPRDVLTAQEMERVLTTADPRSPFQLRDRAILETLYSTGIRRSELANLMLRDIDRERGVVTIRRGKGRKDRIVPIGDRALLFIDKYLDEVRAKLVAEPDSGFVFIANYGEPVSPKRIGQIVGDAFARAEINKRGGCHLFRHTAATLMLENGADIRFIQAFLGHESLETTQIYTKVAIGKLKEVHTNTHPAARFRRRSYETDTTDHDQDDEAVADKLDRNDDKDEPEGE